MTLTGKRALVTGGGDGVGASIARLLAARGADVAITHHQSGGAAAAVVRDVKALGRRALAIQADSTDVDDLCSSVDRAAAELGGLDILVNTAGDYRQPAIRDRSIADLKLLPNPQQQASIITSKAAIAHFGDGGRIVNVEIAFPRDAPTASGLPVFALSNQIGPRGITVDVVQLGPLASSARPVWGLFGEALRSIASLGNYRVVEDIAQMVASLVTPKSGVVS